MSQAQLDELKRLTKTVIEQEYLSKVHEMRKKLSVAMAREARLEEDLKRKEEEMKAYKSCHDCHRVNVDRRSITSQTDFKETEAQLSKEGDESLDTTANQTDTTIGQNTTLDSKRKSAIADIFKSQRELSPHAKRCDSTEPVLIELDDSDV